MSARPAALRRYAITGVRCSVMASAWALEQLDASYGAFVSESVPGTAHFALGVVPDGEEFVVVQPSGPDTRYPDESEALVAVVNLLVGHLLTELARRGIYAIHAASLRHGDGVVIISGTSGAGKTTLALGLLQRGLGLLSDELALSAPDGVTILPYRRALHIRGDTPELIGGLEFLGRPTRRLFGGERGFAVLPVALAAAFPGSLGEAAPLRAVVLLDERTPDGSCLLEPVPAAAAVIELLRATPAAATEFGAALARLTGLVDEARCARVRPGTPKRTIEALGEWLGAPDGG